MKLATKLLIKLLKKVIKVAIVIKEGDLGGLS